MNRFAAALGGLLWVTTAHAQTDEAGWRVEAGARLGLSRPFGRYESGPASTNGSSSAGRLLSDDITYAAPLTLTVGARWSSLFVGVAGSYAFVSARAIDCSDIEPCNRVGDGSAARAQLVAQYRLPLDWTLAPWLGLGAGMEWLDARRTRYWAAPALEMAVGADYRFPSGWLLGPFLGLSAARFGHGHYSGSQAYMSPVFMPPPEPPPRDRDISNRAWHGWIELGFRGAFTL
jgi:hypothetical protein